MHEGSCMAFTGLLDASWAAATTSALVTHACVTAHGPEQKPKNDEDQKNLHETSAHSYLVPT